MDTFWMFLTVLIVAAAAGGMGYFVHHWQVVQMREQAERVTGWHDERDGQWLAYQEQAEVELEKLRNERKTYSFEALQQANATIDRLNGSLRQSDAAYEGLLAQHRAARALRTPTDAWAQRLAMPVERETTGAVFDQEAENEVVAEKRAALATVTRIPVKSYPAKSRPRRKRRR